MKNRKLAMLVLMMAAVSLGAAQSVSPVQTVDRLGLTGTWHEIARMPNRREKHCASNAIELIAIGDKPTKYQLVDACTDVKGYKDSWNFTGIDKAGNGALKVRTIFPFSRKYWVLALGPAVAVESPAAAAGTRGSSQSNAAPPPQSSGYAWTLIGTPNHKRLWIFARSATLSAEEFGQIKARASAEGFDAGKLVVNNVQP